MASIQPYDLLPNFDVFGKNYKRSAVKHSAEKPSLLNYVNLSSTFLSKIAEFAKYAKFAQFYLLNLLNSKICGNTLLQLANSQKPFFEKKSK